MRRIILAVAALALAAPSASAQTGERVPSADWEVPFGGRPRDPYVAPDGSVFFVGQAGNYIGRLDPRGGNFTRFEIDSGTNPHNLIIDRDGNVYYAGNRNGMIGKLDPRTRQITRYPMPDPTVRDPHTLTFDAQGNIWFTAQNSNAIGHLDVRSGNIRLVKTGERTRPYGIELNSRGIPYVNLFGTNKIAKVDPATMEVTTFDLPHERARSRRIAITPDDVVWYTDYTRGFLGRLDPTTGPVARRPRVAPLRHGPRRQGPPLGDRVRSARRDPARLRSGAAEVLQHHAHRPRGQQHHPPHVLRPAHGPAVVRHGSGDDWAGGRLGAKNGDVRKDG
jgi:virginiamycin B lyase